MGPGIKGAFDSADFLQLLETFDTLGAPLVLSRFVANWMTARSFRIRLVARTGQYVSSLYIQNRGAPQGGVLPPLIWLLLVNGLPDRARSHLRLVTPSFRMGGDFFSKYLRATYQYP